MTYSGFDAKVLLRVALLCLTLSAPAVVLVQGWPEVLVFLVPLLLYQVVELLRFVKKAQDELNQFLESVHYRDFSRHFTEKQDSVQLEALRKGFNDINATFQSISREKETQHQQLQRILELVDTGIMTYDMDSGEILLMNEAVRKLLHVPYLKSVHALAKRDAVIYKQMMDMEAGDSTIATTQTAHLEHSALKILLSATAWQSNGNRYKLVAFQNINEAMEETESQAWQKLLNVMTHEIMNSIAPISSLADTLKNRLKQATQTGASPHDLEDLEVGVGTIQRRSEGLLRFAQTYRNLSRITTLHLTQISLQELFANLQQLLQPTLAQKRITLRIAISAQHLSLQADPNLLDQVLINLLLNAIEAVKEQPEPEITLAAYPAADGKIILKVSDNGIGMTAEVQEKIFIPFFTTKKQGSGIGLSLCKQIMLLHRGHIQVQSEAGVGTAFILRFA